MIHLRAIVTWLVVGGALLLSGSVVAPAYPTYGYAPSPAYYAGGGYYYGLGHGGRGHRW